MKAAITYLRNQTVLFYLLVFSGLVLLAMILWEAAVMEDAYITFRVVDNFVQGFGLRWNLHERVQPYTNPLWMFLHIPVYLVYRNIYIDTLVISLVCTELAVFLTIATFRKSFLPMICLFFLPLAMSRAFTLYSTSGFENSLEHLLFACFGWFLLRGRQDRMWFNCSLCIALSMVNRLDALVFYVPVCLYLFRSRRAQADWRQLMLGFAPIVAWELFSLFYYGFLFPNTKYAKLDTGVPQSEYFELGISYLANLFAVDLPSALLLAGGAALSVPLFLRYRKKGNPRDALFLAIAGGIVFYVAYVVCVGGTYLSGRMFSLPIFASAWLLLGVAGEAMRERNLVIVAGAFVIIKLFLPPQAWVKQECPVCVRGVDDFTIEMKDRLGDYLNGKVTVPEPGAQHVPQPVWLEWSMGKWGYGLDRQVKVVDGFALVDPLLARLPMSVPHIVTMGMTLRQPPPGYMEAVATGNTGQMDPDLAQYYSKLRIIISGDLFSAERLEEILKFNLGAYDYLLAQYLQKYPPPKRD